PQATGGRQKPARSRRSGSSGPSAISWASRSAWNCSHGSPALMASRGGPRGSFGPAGPLGRGSGRARVAGEPLVAWSEQAKARVLGDLGGRAYEAARKQGAQMRQDDVIAYAL